MFLVNCHTFSYTVILYLAYLLHRDSIIVSVGDTLTCIFAGFVIFSYLGHMAGELNVKVEDVAQEGQMNAFQI